MGGGVPQDDAIADGFEDIFVADGQSGLHVGVVLEHLVDVVGEGVPFGVEHCVVDRLFDRTLLHGYHSDLYNILQELFKG